jgi:7-cyano-7-deazaguanine reductase
VEADDVAPQLVSGRTSSAPRETWFAHQSGHLHSSPMPQPELLETFANPYPDRDYEIHMTCPEFTSLCPLGGVESDATELALLKGGAPDFGTIVITYVPGEVCVELKSLKLYLWSFRNDGIFYERAVNRILDDLSACVKPRWMEVVGDFNIRGGIKSVIRARVGNRK